MVIFPLAPDQTIAQMWSNGAREIEPVAMYVKDRCQSKALLTSNSVKGATVGHELMWLEIIKKGQTYIVGLWNTALANDIEELSCQYPHMLLST